MVVDSRLQPGEDSAPQLGIAIATHPVGAGKRIQEGLRKARPPEKEIVGNGAAAAAQTPLEEGPMTVNLLGRMKKSEKRPFTDGH